MNDFVRDWRRWTKGERMAFNFVLGSMLIATACLAI
jgi:hypothetical protein